MRRPTLSSLAVLALLVCTRQSIGQISQSGLISTSDASRAGLKRAWYTHIQVDRAKGTLAYITQFISPTKATTIFEINHDGGQIVISEKHLDPFGLPWGKEGAKKQAEEKIAELKNLGQNPKLTVQTVPEITLYIATDRGVVHALDGETGRTRWALAVGKTTHPTLEPAASDRYVAIVNGSNLFVLSAIDGRTIWTRQLKGAPGAGGALTGDLVHVPMVNGMMESYRLNDQKMGSSLFKSHGRAMIQPTATDRSVCWPTDRGHVYVGHADKPGVRYRLEANDTILAPVTYRAPNNLYIASVDGYVYKAHETNGDILWRFSAGESLSQQPVVLDDGVFVVSNPGNLFRISDINGTETWSAPHVKSILSISKDRVYCSGDAGKLIVIDSKTGARLASFDGLGLDLRYNNILTDRIFLGTKTGVIQCLHETKLKYPVVHSGLGGEEKERPQVVQKGLKPGEEGEGDKPGEPGAEPDPFGEKPDPGMKEPGAKEDDPFGTGPAPKGPKAPPPAAEKDPFGG